MDGAVLALHAGLDAVLVLQDGIIRRDQAMAAGLSGSTVASKVYRERWLRVLPRVYAVDVDPSSATSRVRAAALWAGDDAVVTGEAAAWWWGLTDRAPGTVEVVVGSARRMSRVAGIEVLRTDLSDLEIDRHRRIPVTTPAATCLHLARSGRPDLLEVALRRGLRGNLLDETLEVGRGRPGQAQARRSRERVRDNPWSSPESCLHGLFRNAGIAGWSANPTVRLPVGVRYPDVLFVDVKLVVEVDGHRYHRTATHSAADLARQNAFVDQGYTVLRFTPAQLADEPDLVVALVRRTVQRLTQTRAAG